MSSTGKDNVKSDSEKEAHVGTLCELMVLDQQYDKNGKLVVISKIDRSEGSDPEFTEHALVHRRIFNKFNELVETKLAINSPYILKALESVVEYYPSHPTYFNEPLTIDRPYMLLCHHWAELEEYRTNTTSDEARMHLNFLLGFMDRELGQDKKKSERLIKVGHTSFALCWTIFKPGALIVSQGAQTHLYRLRKIKYSQDQEGRFLKLSLCSCQYDGTLTGRYDSSDRLNEGVVGEAAVINGLSFYPLEYAEKPEEIIQRVRARGERFLNFRGIYVQRYRGLLHFLKQPPLGFFSGDRREYSGSFIPKNVCYSILFSFVYW